MKKRILAIVLLLSFTLSACGKGVSANSTDLMTGVKDGNIQLVNIEETGDKEVNKAEEITDFSIELFSENFKNENILFSPLSIISALSMVTNGAKNDTLSQLEMVLNSDIQGLNDYLKAYVEYLPSDEKYKVNLANSIWFKDVASLTVEPDFLQTNKDYYDASVFKAPFDNSTKDDINSWVKENTDGMIEKLLSQAPPEAAVMYLINALSFDAEWQKVYEKEQVVKGDFILEDGKNTKQTVEFMQSVEHSYLETEMGRGFTKPYKGGKYSFAALLPNEDVAMGDFLDSLGEGELTRVLENKTGGIVHTQLPKFSFEYSTSLSESLKGLGVEDAFDISKADFTGLGKSADGNIFISDVIHKTKIDVGEKGTKAGAVTAVIMETGAAMPEEPKEVFLNRPFFYMIIDNEQNIPIFMGSLMNVE